MRNRGNNKKSSHNLEKRNLYQKIKLQRNDKESNEIKNYKKLCKKNN